MAEKLEVGKLAIDFTLTDVHNHKVSLLDYIGHKSVVLVFNRGFA